MQAATHALKRRVIKQPDQISPPAPEEEEAERAAPAATGAAADRARAARPAAPPAAAEADVMPAPAPQAEAPRRRAAAPAGGGAEASSRGPRWRIGTVTRWPDGGWFGFIGGSRLFGDGEPEPEEYWTNLSRLVTSDPPAEGDEVLFIEHPRRADQRNKVAVLVGAVGQECEGVLTTAPGNRPFRFAEIKDAQGNSAEIYVVPPQGGSLAGLAAGTRVVFDLGRNEMGPVGQNAREPVAA
jgi:hypothetical protein